MRNVNKKCAWLMAACVLLCCFLASCDGGFSVGILREKELHGAPVTKEIDLPYDEKEGLDLSVALNIVEDDSMHITVLPTKAGEAPRAVITYPKDFEDHGFSAAYQGGALVLEAEDKYRFRCNVLDVVLYADLRDCTLSGAMDIEVDYTRQSERFSLTVNGAADCEIENLRCGVLEITCNGASSLSAEGAADHFLLTVNGAGDVEATELLAQRCEVEINGAGNAEVYASESLKVEIYGVGNVSYLGDPHVAQTIGGAGSVKKLQDRDE